MRDEKRCDGAIDCKDRSDELGCGEWRRCCGEWRKWCGQ